jgi:hypothetical protein
MSSVIRGLYSTLASKQVTIGSVTPKAYDLDNLPSKVVPAMLPCRLLTPMSPRADARDYSFIALGKLSKLTWHINDLLLWQPEASGTGLYSVAPVLVDYAAAYIEMLRQNRAMSQVQCHIISARFTYGVFEWPEQSGQYFDGVSCDIDIEEVLSGA